MSFDVAQWVAWPVAFCWDPREAVPKGEALSRVETGLHQLALAFHEDRQTTEHDLLIEAADKVRCARELLEPLEVNPGEPF